MRVLMSGRRALALAVSAAVVALVLPASAGAAAPSATPAGGSHQVSGRVGSSPVVAEAPGTTGVALGPAVKYVRLADGTVQRIR